MTQDDRTYAKCTALVKSQKDTIVELTKKSAEHQRRYIKAANEISALQQDLEYADARLMSELAAHNRTAGQLVNEQEAHKRTMEKCEMAGEAVSKLTDRVSSEHSYAKDWKKSAISALDHIESLRDEINQLKKRRWTLRGLLGI